MRGLLLVLMLLSSLGAADDLATRAHALARAVWASQDADGAWRSRHYAMLADGPVLTAVLLAGLADLPASPGQQARALAYLRTAVDGHIGADRDLPGYPTYAAAFALLALVRHDDPHDAERIASLSAWLRARQRQESDDLPPAHAAHGGWGFGRVTRPGFAGHTDLAHTRWALTALAEAGALDAATVTRARLFLARCQRRERSLLPAEAPPADGGCYLSPVVWPANKGGPGHWSASYASATADGLVALRLCGDEAGAQAAAAWLAQHDDWQLPAGIPAGDPDWRQSLRFYHWAARAAASSVEGGWEAGLLAVLPPPRDDGLYANPAGFLMKEDDPLVASGLLLHALTAR